jgi:hypothetical protein
MKNLLSSFFIAVICSSFITCKTAHPVQNESGPDIGYLIKKIQKDPGNEKTVEQLKQKYTDEVQLHESKINDLNKTDIPENKEQVLFEYSSLQNLYNSISSVPGPAKKINPTDYSQQIVTTKILLEKQLTENADGLLTRADKTSCRQAYQLLLKLNSYKPGNPVITEKLNRTLKCGSYTISVDPPAGDGNLSYFSLEINEFSKELLFFLKQQKLSPFILITENESNPETDEIVRIRIINIETGNLVTDKSSRDVVNNNAYTATGRRSRSTTPSNTSATVINTHSSLTANAALVAEVVTRTGDILDRQEFKALFEWSSDANTYTGDRRALTTNDRVQISTPSSSRNPPGKVEITTALLKQLSEKLLLYLQNRYSKI